MQQVLVRRTRKKNKRCTVQRKQQRWIQQVLWSNNERRNQRERREHFVSPFFSLGLCEKPSFDTHCSSCCSQVSLQFQRLLSVYQMLVHLFSRPIPMNLVPKFFLSSPLGGSFKNSKRHESFFFLILFCMKKIVIKNINSVRATSVAGPRFKMNDITS